MSEKEFHDGFDAASTLSPPNQRQQRTRWLMQAYLNALPQDRAAAVRAAVDSSQQAEQRPQPQPGQIQDQPPQK